MDNDHTNAPGASITASAGANWIDPKYDAAGNVTEGPLPGGETTKQKYVYDAWNRLVEVQDSAGTALWRYEYDGLNRRILKTDKTGSPDVDYSFYYNLNWQVLEVRKDGDTDPYKQYVWDSGPAGTDVTSMGIKGGRYIDAPAIRYYDSDTDGSGIVTNYYTNDANMNVTALLDSTGDVVERYE